VKYRIWSSGDKFKVQRKRFFRCVWLDACNSWNNWYGKDAPKLFNSEKSVLDFLTSKAWRVKGIYIRDIS